MFNEGSPSVLITNITMEEIQKRLEENTQLILAVMEYQRVRKFEECAAHRAQLQQNLTFLAQLADASPQPAQPPPPPAVLPQMTVHSMAQHGQWLQHSEAAMSQQQVASPFARMHIQLNDDQQQQQPSWLHQQQFVQALVGSNPIAASDVHIAPMQLGDGSGSNMLDLVGNNQVGLGSGNAVNFLGKTFSGCGSGDADPWFKC